MPRRRDSFPRYVGDAASLVRMEMVEEVSFVIPHEMTTSIRHVDCAHEWDTVIERYDEFGRDNHDVRCVLCGHEMTIHPRTDERDWFNMRAAPEVEPYEWRDRERGAGTTRAEPHSTLEPVNACRHEWSVTDLTMDGGVRFNLACAHCDLTHRRVDRDRMEQLIDSNTGPESSRLV